MSTRNHKLLRILFWVVISLQCAPASAFYISDLAIDTSGTFGNYLYISTRAGTADSSDIYHLELGGTPLTPAIPYFHSDHAISSIGFSNSLGLGTNLYATRTVAGTQSSHDILRIDSTKTSAVFSSGAPHLMTGLAISGGGLFQEGLYTSEVTNFPGGFVEFFDVLGNRSTFSTFSPTILTDAVFGSAAFGNTNLLVANSAAAANGEIYQVDPTGANSIFTNLPDDPVALAIAPDGSSFGNFLYATTGMGNIYRISSDGAFSLFYEGLQGIDGFTGDIVFDPDADSLYVAAERRLFRFDAGGAVPTEIATFVPVPAALWLFGTGLLGLFAVTGKKRAS